MHRGISTVRVVHHSMPSPTSTQRHEVQDAYISSGSTNSQEVLLAIN